MLLHYLVKFENTCNWRVALLKHGVVVVRWHQSTSSMQFVATVIECLCVCQSVCLSVCWLQTLFLRDSWMYWYHLVSWLRWVKGTMLNGDHALPIATDILGWFLTHWNTLRFTAAHEAVPQSECSCQLADITLNSTVWKICINVLWPVTNYFGQLCYFPYSFLRCWFVRM